MLESMALFAGLTPGQFANLAHQTTARRLRPHALVCTQGDPGDSLYLIRSGQVKRYLSGDDGREIVLDYLGPGDHFGEVALMIDAPHPTSVAAIKETSLILMGRRAFRQCLEDHPTILWNLSRTLAERLNQVTEAYAGLALRDCYERVIRVLEESAKDEGERRITPPLTQKAIAARIGCSREMVSRVIKELKAGGYVEVEAKRLVILRRPPRKR